jgi:hypothetical protein
MVQFFKLSKTRQGSAVLSGCQHRLTGGCGVRTVTRTPWSGEARPAVGDRHLEGPAAVTQDPPSRRSAALRLDRNGNLN